MELSKDTIKTFTDIQDINVVSDDNFQLILESVIFYICKTSVEPKNIKTAADSKPVATKSSFANVARLFAEASRRDLDEENLRTFLSNAGVNEQRAKKLCDTYSDNKKIIQTQLELIGYNPQHVIDVDWRLDYCVKFDMCNSIGVPVYHIRLKTKEHETMKNVTFTCTIQQLQELVSKLKDAVRHLEKLTNV